MRAKWVLYTVHAGNRVLYEPCYIFISIFNPAMLYFNLISEAVAMAWRCEADAQHFSSKLLAAPCDWENEG